MDGEKYTILKLIKRKQEYCTNFKKNRLQSKESYQGQRRPLRNDKGVNSLRHNNP